jgi:dihydropteroate synthase
MLAQGADILDIGGESSRPGAEPVSVEEELSRVLPFLREAVTWNVPISVDTYKSEVMQAALDLGVDIVGGIPHGERTMADGAASLKELCEIAAERGLLVDIHCDESDDPWSRHVETLVYETQRLGLQGPRHVPE